MKNSSLGLSLLAGLGVLMAACGSDSGSGGGGCEAGQVACDGVCIDEIAPTLGGDNGVQAAVFGLSCTFSSCHGTEGVQQAGLELSSVTVSDENLVDVDSTQVPTSLRVDAGDSSASYLMNKLLGIDMAPMTQQMPITGTLCEARLEAVRDWIDAGAPVQ